MSSPPLSTSSSKRNIRQRRIRKRPIPCWYLCSTILVWTLSSASYPPSSTSWKFLANAEESPSPEHKLRSSVSSNNHNNNNSNRRTTTTSTTSTRSYSYDSRNDGLFLKWCSEALGIETLLEIKTFEYYDTIRAMKDRIDDFCEDCFEKDDDNYDDDEFGYLADEDEFLSVSEYPTISVRGLAAARDIQAGEVVIRIPRFSLWTVANAIDNDPVLSQVMGPKSRQEHGWNDNSDELALLAVAVLYRAGTMRYNHDAEEESLYYPYVDLLEATPIESIPHLWDSAKLRHDATIGVRKVAKGIQRDIQEMYESIVMVLIEEHSDLFGPIDQSSYRNVQLGRMRSPQSEEDIYDDDERDSSEDEEEWMFSLERFHWAFALVNSRHWHLPIPPIETTPNDQEKRGAEDTNSLETDSTTESNIHLSEQASPPAAMPTEDWLDMQREEQRKEEESSFEIPPTAPTAPEDLEDIMAMSFGNSFLAPVADLLNFGPPCTRGVYNKETNCFEIIASCDFQQGQEVTFWYADACQDVFVANYGFTHPAVPKCDPPGNGLIHQLKQKLLSAEEELETLDRDLVTALQVLSECDCKLKEGEDAIALDNASKQATPSRISIPASPIPPKPMLPKQHEQQARHAIRGGHDGLTRGGSQKRKRVNSRKSDL